MSKTYEEGGRNDDEAKLQYWRNGVMMGIVSRRVAFEIMNSAKGAGLKVFYVEGDQHFSVEGETHFVNLGD